MPADAWDTVDALLLSALGWVERSLADLVEVSDLPRDAVAGLVHGYLAARYVTQPLPGCDRYRLTLMGRARLLILAHRTSLDTTRKAA